MALGSTTYYFQDLDELIAAAMAAAAQEEMTQLKEWEDAVAHHPDLPEVFTALIVRDLLTEPDQHRAVNNMYLAASHRPELRELAGLWANGLIAILTPRLGPVAAEAVAVFVDGVCARTMINDDPPEAPVLKAALRALMSIPSEPVDQTRSP